MAKLDLKIVLREKCHCQKTLEVIIKDSYFFYKLLVENDKNLNLIVTHGEFEFVEPKENGKLVNRLFELKDEDVTELKKLIFQVLDEIKNLEFLNEISL